MSFDSRGRNSSSQKWPSEPDEESNRSVHVSSRSDAAKSVVADEFSRGVTRDKVRDYNRPYVCRDCGADGRRFATAIQLSDHYLQAHDKRMHASLIKPETKQSIGGGSDSD
jgi:hypothetical protein